MTSDRNEHRGSVFFALPDGNGLLYQLIGHATAPLPAAAIVRSIPCKAPYTHLLAVKNWLKTPQRFKASIESESLHDPAISIKGLDYIDVPALGERQFKLNFFSYKETTTNIKVIFLNEETHEYIFYTLQLLTTPPEVLNVIELETPVRKPVNYSIRLENPLDVPTTLTTTCDCEDVTVPPLTLGPRTDGHLELTFLPLVPKELTARLTVTSAQLGVYIYDLHLKSTLTGNEKPLQFRVGLGSKIVQTFRFTSYARAKTEYQCKVDHPDFSVDKSIAAPAAPLGGIEMLLDVLYEPSKLGDIRATLTVSSEQGGEFTCSLFGHCVNPQPQGPITIKGGSPASVPIFNPFVKQAVFTLGVDNPAYTVKPNELTIPSKKSATATISYKASSASLTTGKLVVTSEDSPAPWIYYLKGSN